MRPTTAAALTTLALALSTSNASAQATTAPSSLANPAYTACTEWVETLNYCTDADHDPTTGCEFAASLDPAEAARFECWTDVALETAQGPGICDLSATAACEDILGEPEEVVDPEAEAAISKCTAAVTRVDACLTPDSRSGDDPELRCQMAYESGHLTLHIAEALDWRTAKLSCDNHTYIARLTNHSKYPPTLDAMACAETCVAYHQAFNSCSDAAGWSNGYSDEEIAAACNIGGACQQHDYVGYYQCLANALPTDCSAEEAQVGSVYACQLD